MDTERHLEMGTEGHLDASTDWYPLLRDQFSARYWEQLTQFVAAERAQHPVYPPADQVFDALHLTSYASTRAVILGQDPYHGPGQAHGLCFSVRHGVRTPPSLMNVHRELHADLAIEPPGHGNLEAWARHGVLLLNTTLTVRCGAAGSHRKRGWETFTDAVIAEVNRKQQRVVFVLWGAAARAKSALVDTSRHVIIESAHPSPLSARNGFVGSRPFSRTNTALTEAGLDPIEWSLN
jgi:uracil-DNA glycosylase